MSNKLLSRLLSFTLSATVALTSGVPALAYDGGGGEDLLEVEDEELLEIEDEIELEDAGADFDATEDEFVEDEIVVEEAEEIEDDAILEEIPEEDAEFEQGSDITRAIVVSTLDGNYSGATTGTANRADFAYGLENLPNVTNATGYAFNATVSASAYNDVSWSIYKIKDTTVASDTTKKPGDPRYASTNLEEVNLADYGLALKPVTTAKGTVYIAVNNAPIKALAPTVFALKAVDNDNTDNVGFNDVTIEIKEASITADPAKLDGTSNGAGGNYATFTTAKMGYEVKAASATPTAAETTARSYTKAVEIALKATGISSAYKVTDMTYEWTGDDPTAFAVVTGDGKGIYNNNPETITLKPNTGLTSKGSKNGDGIYEATLKVKSQSLLNPVQIPVKFTVESNLAFTKVVAHGDKDADWHYAVATVNDATTFGNEEAASLTGELYTRSGAGTTASPYVYTKAAAYAAATTFYKADGYNLGTFKVGERISDVVITATGGNGIISLIESGTFVTNITGTASEQPDIATYTVAGKVDKYTGQSGEHSFTLTAKDADLETSSTINFFYTVASADLEATIADEDIAIGGTTTFSWFAKKGYTADDETKTIKIKNNGEDTVNLSAALNNSNFTIDATTLSIAKNETKTIVVKPKAAQNPTGSNAVSTANLVLTSDSIASTTIGLTFTEYKDALNISKPATDPSSDPATIPAAEIGKAYSYQFEATKADSIRTVKWSVTGATIPDGDDVGTDPDPVDIADYGLALNSTTGALTGAPTKAGTLTIGVKCEDAANSATNATRSVVLAIAPSSTAIKLTSGGNEISTTKKLDLGKVRLDQLDSIEAVVKIANNTKIDMTKVTAAVSAVTGGSGNTNQFKIVFYPDDKVLDADAQTNGIGIEAGSNKDIRLKANLANLAYAAGSAGKYEITVLVTDETSNTAADHATASFTATLEIVEVPAIVATTVAGYAWTVGTEVKTTADKKYTASLSTDSNAQFTYAWTKGGVPGLSISEGGVVFGTPTTAGKYEVTVTATKKGDSSVTASLTHDIVVAGESTLAISTTLKTGQTLANNVLVLPGMVVGDNGVGKATINLASSSKDAQNVRITVTDADDTGRTAAEKKKNPENPWAGSAQYIGVSQTSYPTLATDDDQNFRILSQGSPKAGVYKVKIKITADNASPVEFYALMVVADKLTITQPENLTTSIGAAIAANKYNVTATGGTANQTIIWSEGGTKVTREGVETTEYYITATPGTSGTTSTLTGLSLSTEASTIGAANGVGLKNDIYTPTKILRAGSCTVNLKAKVDGTAAYNKAGTDEFDKLIALSDKTVADVATRGITTDLVYSPALWDSGNSAITPYPAQEADPVTFTIVSTKSRDVTITNATGTAGEVEGMKNGNTQVTYTGFAYNPVVTYALSGTTYDATVTITNGAGVAVTPVAKLSDNSDFTVTAVGGASGSLAANGTRSYTVSPKASLAKGTHTDKLVISGNEFETLEFNVTFTVADATYLATVDNDISPDATTNIDKRIEYAKENTPSGKAIELKNRYAGQSATAQTLVIRNVGNTALSNILVYEVKADGSKYADGDTATMLSFSQVGGATVGGAANWNLAATTLATGTTGKTGIGFKVTPKKGVAAAEAGVYSTYLNVHFTEGTGASATPRDIKIPVTYTVYSKDLETLTVSPETVAAKTAVEGYTNTDYAFNFTVQNTGTNAYNNIVNLTATSSNANFVVTRADDKKDLAAGASVGFTVTPARDLSEGTYTATITFTGDNVKSTAVVTREVKFTVTGSTSYTAKVVTAADSFSTVVDAVYYRKLWNSLITSTVVANKATALAAGDVNKYNTDGTSGDTTVWLDIDADGSNNVEIVFYSDAETVTFANDLNTAGTTILTNVAAKTLTLTAAQKTAITTANSANKYYATITFNFYTKSVFGAAAGDDTNASNGTVYNVKYDDLKNDFVMPEEKYSVVGDYKDYAIGTMTVYVPYGKTIGSVFTNGELPAAIESGKSMTAWYVGDGTGAVDVPVVMVSKAKTMYADIAEVVPAFHNHTYAPSTETDEKYVKWIWTKDAKGNLAAELHLYCTDTECPDKTASEIIVNDKSTVDGTIIQDSDGVAGAPLVPLTYSTPVSSSAECEHGAAYKFPVKAVVKGITYIGYYYENEVGEPLGHSYDLTVDADIVWTDTNKDGLMTADEVKVTRECSRDASHIKELTVVSIGEDKKVEPTCTKAGSVVYTITYTEIKANGDAAGNKTVKYNNGTAVVLKATGHAETLTEDVEDFDEETLKGYLTLTCPKCNEVLFAKKLVQFKAAADGTYTYDAVLSNGDPYTVKYDHVEFVMAKAEWTWSADHKTATVLFTSTAGKTKELTVTFTETDTTAAKYLEITPGEDYSIYHAYASFMTKGKKVESEDTKYIDKDGNEIIPDTLYNATVNWTKKFDTKYTKGTGLPVIEYTITYTSKNTGESATTEAIAATVTADKDYSAESTEKEITFTATADLSKYYKDKEATTPATAAPLTVTYKFKNGGLYGTSGQEIGGDMIVEGLEDEYFYTGAPIKPTMVVTDGDMVLAQGVDYTVKYRNNTKISSKTGDEYTKTAEVTVTGKGNYAGQGQTLYFAIIDPKDEVKEDDADLTGATMKLPKETLIYTGEAVYPSAIELKLKGGSYVTYKHQGDGVYANDDSDIPAVVTFANNVNKGSATVMLTGKPNAKGVTKTLKKNFTIKALALNTTDFTVNVAETAVWAVKGAQPEVTVTWNGSDLVLGQDFTVSYDKSNKKVGASKLTVKGKGNFTKKLEQSFTVTALPLAEEMVAAVSAFVGKKGAKVTLLDGAGNVIPTSLYTVSVFDGETDVTKAKLEADKDYTIKIAKKAGKTELGDDALEITAQAGINLSSVKINAKSVEKTFTGEAITLTDDDIAKITVTYKGTTLVYGTDYEITGYANNIKKGKMTVTIAGMGKYAGFKTFKVKIAPKPIAATN